MRQVLLWLSRNYPEGKLAPPSSPLVHFLPSSEHLATSGEGLRKPEARFCLAFMFVFVDFGFNHPKTRISKPQARPQLAPATHLGPPPNPGEGFQLEKLSVFCSCWRLWTSEHKDELLWPWTEVFKKAFQMKGRWGHELGVNNTFMALLTAR